MSKENDELPSLKHLDEHIRRVKDRVEPVQKQKLQGTGGAMRMGVELLSGAFVGSVVGLYLDKWLGSSPFLFILCFFLGCAGGFITLMRTMKINENEKLDKEETTL